MHGALAAWVAAMAVFGTTFPANYEAALQEDHFVEWWTVTLFGAAGLFALRLAWTERRFFDALIGAFCVFVAGEEFSWGQRLLGLTPPDAFLERNRQQEITLHNFASVFGEPKWVLTAALLGFGLVLPLLATSDRGARVLAKLGATAPRFATASWLLIAAALLVWYPLSLTGEWVEALAGSLFLVSYSPSIRGTGLAAGAGAVVAAALTLVSGVGLGGTDAQLACARLETTGLAEDLAYGRGATARLAGAPYVHKRVFTAMQEGYLDLEGLAEFRAAECAGQLMDPTRREHAIDPWGSAYWIRVQRDTGAVRLVVYSFGPNRRRDGEPGDSRSDDQAAVVEIPL